LSAPITAFLFPGQGSQKVGMGRAWAEGSPAAREVFNEASSALGFDVAKLCWHGTDDELQLTANTQPALLTVSIAIERALAERGVAAPSAVAGHSLGEYSAHVAAGTLSLADALRLVRRRGQLMQEAVPVGVGAMAAVLGMAPEAVAEVTRDAAGDEVCAVANFNSPEQTVIAGHATAVARAIDLARQRGAKRAIPLPVSAPFHSLLMAPARAGLTPDLERARFADPRVPVVVNIDAGTVTTGAAARDALIRQIDGPVRWVESVRCLWQELGVRRFVEIGPGSVLSGLVRRIVPEATTLSLAEPAALAEIEES
jgi:[acyl-carrier-protein] S-malonyltransferase